MRDLLMRARTAGRPARTGTTARTTARTCTGRRRSFGCGLAGLRAGCSFRGRHVGVQRLVLVTVEASVVVAVRLVEAGHAAVLGLGVRYEPVVIRIEPLERRPLNVD